MRREPVEQQLALAQRLAHQPEVELLEVAQAAVDRACSSGARCRRRSRAPRPARRQPARGGVERAARRRSTPPPIDDDVEGLVAPGAPSAARRCSGRAGWLVRVAGYSGASVRREQHGGLHRRDRPGHDEHALHPVRPRRRGSSPSTSASTSRSCRRPGWVEHDADGDLAAHARGDRRRAGRAPTLEAGDIAAIGITNQRETTVVWDRETGEPVYNAIVWQDTRTDALVRELAGDEGVDRLRDGDRAAALDLLLRPEDRAGSSTTSTARASAPRPASCAFGTIDTWLLWNLTGGATAACTSPT